MDYENCVRSVKQARCQDRNEKEIQTGTPSSISVVVVGSYRKIPNRRVALMLIVANEEETVSFLVISDAHVTERTVALI